MIKTYMDDRQNRIIPERERGRGKVYGGRPDPLEVLLCCIKECFGISVFYLLLKIK